MFYVKKNYFNMNINEITAATIEWAREKGILKVENRFSQCLKKDEEIGEASEYQPKEKEAMEIGDVMVTNCILATQCGIDFLECCKYVDYDKIDLHIPDYRQILIINGKIAGCLLKDDFDGVKKNIGKLINRYQLIVASANMPSLTECFEMAYNKIKYRIGKTNSNGTFIKN